MLREIMFKKCLRMPRRHLFYYTNTAIELQRYGSKSTINAVGNSYDLFNLSVTTCFIKICI